MGDRVHGGSQGRARPGRNHDRLPGIVVRELVGVYEFVSAPIAAPDGYRPLIQPEFPWSYFDETQEIADTRRPDSARSVEPARPEAPSAVNAWGEPVTFGMD
jgi:hypothetical protein